MIKIFATDKVKELDQYTIQHEPISSIDLVERAATTFVHEFCRRYSKQVRIVIFAGQGNNGADALNRPPFERGIIPGRDVFIQPDGASVRRV